MTIIKKTEPRKILEWAKDSKAQMITIEELDASVGVRNRMGEYAPKFPLKHSEFINNIAERVGEDWDVTIGNIFVPKNRIGIVHEMDPKKEGLIKAAMFRSLIGEILVTNVANDDMTMKLAIAINERGVTLAQGPNISVCSNMTIMGSSNMISTEGRGSLDFENFMTIFKTWIPNINKTFGEYEKIINNMKEVSLGGNGQIQEMIGSMHMMAVNQAYNLGQPVAPLTINEMSKFSQELIKLNPEQDAMSLWDLYNVGTNILTHAENNVETKLPTLGTFADFIIEKYFPENAIFIN